MHPRSYNQSFRKNHPSRHDPNSQIKHPPLGLFCCARLSEVGESQLLPYARSPRDRYDGPSFDSKKAACVATDD